MAWTRHRVWGPAGPTACTSAIEQRCLRSGSARPPLALTLTWNSGSSAPRAWCGACTPGRARLWTRLDSQALPFEPVALEALLATCLARLHSDIQQTGATVTHDPLPQVMGDNRQLGQLLGNLLGNALKFRGPQAPVLHVGAQRQAGFWHVSVHDNGIGINVQFFERIFVMFQRLHLRAEHPGTGIGLAICKRVVERHGGRLTVQSVPGQSSTFTFTLPCDPGANAAPVDRPSETPP